MDPLLRKRGNWNQREGFGTIAENFGKIPIF
jgi:hypothetical protein